MYQVTQSETAWRVLNLSLRGELLHLPPKNLDMYLKFAIQNGRQNADKFKNQFLYFDKDGRWKVDVKEKVEELDD